MPSARVNDHEGPVSGIDGDTRGRDDANQPVIDRPRQLSPVHYQFVLEAEDIRRLLRDMLEILVAALTQNVPEEDGPLGGIDDVFGGIAPQMERVGAPWGCERHRRVG
jgi:hypothetical protein